MNMCSHKYRAGMHIDGLSIEDFHFLFPPPSKCNMVQILKAFLLAGMFFCTKVFIQLLEFGNWRS